MKKSFIRAIAILSLACVAVLRAQQSEPQVSVDFTVLGWGGEITDLGYRQGTKAVPLRIQNYLRSETYHYTGPATLRLYRYADAPQPAAAPAQPDQDNAPLEYKAPTGPLSKEPVATITLPQTSQKLLLLVSRSGTTVQAYVVQEDLDDSPPGKARFINLTTARIGLRQRGGSSVVLDPKGQCVLAPISDEAVVKIRIGHEKNGDTWAILKDSMVAAPANTQTTVFFLQSDDASFRSMDGLKLGPVQMLTLRIPVQTAKQ